MNTDSELFSDDEFQEMHDEAVKAQKYFALIGFLLIIFFFLLFVATIYFFLAAAGIVPPLDLIPVIPYI